MLIHANCTVLKVKGALRVTESTSLQAVGVHLKVEFSSLCPSVSTVATLACCADLTTCRVTFIDAN